VIDAPGINSPSGSVIVPCTFVPLTCTNGVVVAAGVAACGATAGELAAAGVVVALCPNTLPASVRLINPNIIFILKLRPGILTPKPLFTASLFINSPLSYSLTL
jgi:hypothetical protein